jgi:hypothetical protein
MSVPDKSSYLSRFTIKLVEMVAAGIATAVSGYLVAHLGGYLFSPAPTPAAVQVAPNPGASKGVSTGSRAQPTRAAAADSSQKRLGPAQDVSPPAPQAARTTVNPAQAAAAHNPATTDTGGAESKPRDGESIEERVRAALANVDGNQPAPSDGLPHQAAIPPERPAAGAQPRPTGGPVGTGATAAAPPAADLTPQPPQPSQPSAVQPDPLTTVEIRSRPVADIGALPAPAPAPPDQPNAQAGTDLLSAIKHIPDLLRAEQRASDGDPPRPPLPVGH